MGCSGTPRSSGPQGAASPVSSRLQSSGSASANSSRVDSIWLQPSPRLLVRVAGQEPRPEAACIAEQLGRRGLEVDHQRRGLAGQDRHQRGHEQGAVRDGHHHPIAGRQVLPGQPARQQLAGFGKFVGAQHARGIHVDDRASIALGGLQDRSRAQNVRAQSACQTLLHPLFQPVQNFGNVRRLVSGREEHRFELVGMEVNPRRCIVCCSSM